MTPARTPRLTRRDAALLARRRAEMDRVNRALCALLQQRARLAVEIASWKHARGVAIADPTRERAMLKAMLADAAPGFDTAALARLLRAVLRESRALALREAPRRTTHRVVHDTGRRDDHAPRSARSARTRRARRS